MRKLWAIILLVCIVMPSAMSLGISKPYMKDNILYGDSNVSIPIRFEIQRANSTNEPKYAIFSIGSVSPMKINDLVFYETSVNLTDTMAVSVLTNFKTSKPGLYRVDYTLKEGSGVGSSGISFATNYKGNFFINIDNNSTPVNASSNSSNNSSSNSSNSTNPPGGGGSGGGSGGSSGGRSSGGGIIPSKKTNVTTTNTTKVADTSKNTSSDQTIVKDVVKDVAKDIPKQVVPVVKDTTTNVTSDLVPIIGKVLPPEAKALLISMLISGIITLFGAGGLVFYYYKLEFGGGAQ